MRVPRVGVGDTREGGTRLGYRRPLRSPTNCSSSQLYGYTSPWRKSWCTSGSSPTSPVTSGRSISFSSTLDCSRGTSPLRAPSFRLTPEVTTGRREAGEVPQTPWGDGGGWEGQGTTGWTDVCTSRKPVSIRPPRVNSLSIRQGQATTTSEVRGIQVSERGRKGR